MRITGLKETGLDLDQLGSGEKRYRALIIDDEVHSVLLLKSILMTSGFDVTGAFSGEEAIQKCIQFNPDVILLDLMMPVMDGWETYQHLRKITKTPVMIVSALSDKDKVVQGFTVGAEDYLTKPFHPAELVARIKRLLNRTQQRESTCSYYFPKVGLFLDLETCEVKVYDRTIYLPGKAFEVLAILAKNAPRVVMNEVIAKEIWGEDNTRTQNRIKHLIFVLRQNLEQTPSEPRLIIKRGGMGYRLATEED